MPSSYVIGDHFEAFMRSQVQPWRYASASEVIRVGLPAFEEREPLRAAKLESMRAAIQEGIDSGPGIPPDEVLAELRARVRQVAGRA